MHCVIIMGLIPFQVMVIKFGKKATNYEGYGSNSPCYSRNLALATPNNVNAFKMFVDVPDGTRGRDIQFIPAITKAFEYFKSVDSDIERSEWEWPGGGGYLVWKRVPTAVAVAT